MLSGQPAEKDSREGRFFYPWERTLDRLVTPFEEFIHRQTTSGMILLATSVLAVVLANSPFRDTYLHLTHAPVAFQLGGATLQMSWLHLVNVGFMVFFFFVVGLEIKREVRVGELSEPRKALLPILAALGGMLTPALFYWFLNQSGEFVRGWGIPMATDIAVLLSQRRPSYFMGPGYSALQTLANSYLRLLADAGVISSSLKDMALKVDAVKPLPVDAVPAQFISEKKTQAVLRARLAQALNVNTIYDLDRLDLSVKATIDYNTQQAVATALRKLSDPEEARVAGAFGERRLNENVDLSRVIYSLMLFERTQKGNFLRVQTDNFDQPLDINEGIRLYLGSTSKLRTMVHYLELITEIDKKYYGQPAEELNKVKIELDPRDCSLQFDIRYSPCWVST